MGETQNSDKGSGRRLPPWLRTRFEGGRARKALRQLLRELNLHTVCESAHCPNLCECWSRQAATFLLLGNRCTRHCRFCAVAHGGPSPVDPDEASRICTAVARLQLRFVVLTCVTRDDLPDGGAAHIASVIALLKRRMPEVGVEVLPSDFSGRTASVQTVLDSAPDVFNHNLETVERLTPLVRDRADYRRSLEVLRYAAESSSRSAHSIRIKSGMMLGMGERKSEIRDALDDLRDAGVKILTLGQYLPPSSEHWPLDRYVTPDEFDEWKRIGEEILGFDRVVSGPLVRSSYLAEEAAVPPASGQANGRASGC